MVYLMILVMVAGVGIGSLLVQQRRERAHLDSVEGFKASLEKISPYAQPGPFRRAMTVMGGGAKAPGRPVPLDPERREAARIRVEARRRAALARAHERTVKKPRRVERAPQRRAGGRPLPQHHAAASNTMRRPRPSEAYRMQQRRRVG